MDPATECQSKARQKTVNSSPGELREDARDFFSTVQELIRHYQFRDVNRACEFGITITECHVLDLLAREAPQSINRIAAGMHLDKSTVSRAVQALLDKRLVRCSIGEEDARSRAVALTASGRKLHAAIKADSTECYQRFLGSFPRDARRNAIEVLEAFERALRPGCG